MTEEYDDLPDRYFPKEDRPTKVESIRLPTSFPSSAGGGKRRGMEFVAPVSRDYIRMLVDKFDTIQYGESIRGGLSPEEQRLRNKALPPYCISQLGESRRLWGVNTKGMSTRV